MKACEERPFIQEGMRRAAVCTACAQTLTMNTSHFVSYQGKQALPERRAQLLVDSCLGVADAAIASTEHSCQVFFMQLAEDDHFYFLYTLRHREERVLAQAT